MERLAEIRERRALTLRELSEVSGVAADTINQIELGHRKPRPSTLRKLARALDVEVADFFQEEPTSPKALAPKSLADLRGFLKAQLGSAWIALPEEEWRNWWRDVSREEATKRYQQILNEAALIWDTWGATWEGRAALGRAGLYLLRFQRRLEAGYFAPQQGESEEEFQERSAEGRPAPSYYDPTYQRQRQEMVREVEEEERQLAAA